MLVSRLSAGLAAPFTASTRPPPRESQLGSSQASTGSPPLPARRPRTLRPVLGSAVQLVFAEEVEDVLTERVQKGEAGLPGHHGIHVAVPDVQVVLNVKGRLDL